LKPKSANLRILYLNNVNRFKTSNDVERYAFQLARIDPIENLSELVDSKLGKWLVRFKSDIGKYQFISVVILIKIFNFINLIDFDTVEKNFKLLEKSLPPNLMYEKCYVSCHNNTISHSFKDEKLDLKDLNKRFIYLKNITKFKTPNDVERYAYQLTNLNPCYSELVNESIGKWLIKFNSDISISLNFI
jgi:hypothetical protein